MFDFDKYNKALELIKKEEIENYNDEIEDFEEYDNSFLERRLKLNKDNNIIFKHSLSNAWLQPLEEFYILDEKENNVIIKRQAKDDLLKYTIDYDDIEVIKKLVFEINDKYEVLFPPVLDGTSHVMYFLNDKIGLEIHASNIWYWMDENNFNSKYLDIKKEEIEYTKIIIKCIKEIQKILIKNNVKYKILSH